MSDEQKPFGERRFAHDDSDGTCKLEGDYGTYTRWDGEEKECYHTANGDEYVVARKHGWTVIITPHPEVPSYFLKDGQKYTAYQPYKEEKRIRIEDTQSEAVWKSDTYDRPYPATSDILDDIIDQLPL